MSYHLTGLVSAVIFLLTLWGLGSQLRLIGIRRAAQSSRLGSPGQLTLEAPTAVLSLNQFFSSYLAFYSFLLYGACQPRFNHYLVWPRLAAAVMTLWILFHIWLDRRDARARAVLLGSVALLGAAPVAAVASHRAGAWAASLVQWQVVVITLILVQGYSHQVVLIRRSGSTGAVSLRMHQGFLLKDLSTIGFAVAMGLREGWPVLFLSAASAMTKIITIWHFHWVRVSSVAAARRVAWNEEGSSVPVGRMGGLVEGG